MPRRADCVSSLRPTAAGQAGINSIIDFEAAQRHGRNAEAANASDLAEIVARLADGRRRVAGAEYRK